MISWVALGVIVQLFSWRALQPRANLRSLVTSTFYTYFVMNADLEQRVEIMKREIDALQIAAAERSKPFYKNVSTLLSMLALVFSFGTTFVSYQRTTTQDIQNSRAELRRLIQRMAALPKEHVETYVKYGSDPGARTTISGYINQENTLLARTAAELAENLPAKSVSATEFYAIALALQAAYDLTAAGRFLQHAIDAAPDFNIEISCLRSIAYLKFLQGHKEEGRVEYQRALGIFSKYPQYDAFTQVSTNVQTELSWAFSEAAGNESRLAMQHVENAERMTTPLPPSPGLDGVKSQIAHARAQFSSGAALPNPVSAPQLTVPLPSPATP